MEAVLRGELRLAQEEAGPALLGGEGASLLPGVEGAQQPLLLCLPQESQQGPRPWT